MGETALAAMFMQGAASATTNIINLAQNKDLNADADICKQVQVTSNILSQVDALTGKLVTLKEMDDETKNDIVGLNATIAAEVTKLKAEKKQFRINVYIMIIMNILLVTLISFRLFS
jgi:hypothetical protein